VQNSRCHKKQKTRANNEVATVDLVPVTPAASNCIELDLHPSGADETAPGGARVQNSRRPKRQKARGNNEVATVDLVAVTPGANNCIELDLNASCVDETVPR
ncbi:hypothetical protein SAY86_006886, partial [Trapa natans]